MMRACIAALALTCAARTAHADPEDKSQDVAIGLSAGVSAGGLVLVGMAIAAEDDVRPALGVLGGAAVLAGPTTGHLYVGDPWTTAFIVRMSAAAAVGIGIGFIAYADCGLGGCSGAFPNEAAGVGGALLAAAGALTFTGAWFYEIGTAPRAAVDANARRRARTALLPLLGREPGLAIVGSF